MHQKLCESAAYRGASGKRRLRSPLAFIRQYLDRAAAMLALWHFRARSRREIERLDDRLLRDAGVDRSEANKPFWRE